jgi:serine carboxypeptidase 1
MNASSVVCLLLVVAAAATTAKSISEEEKQAPPQQPKARPNHRHVTNKEGVETWGYVDVRPGAHMFYWLYYTTHVDGYMNKPLIIWFQGGPGASSCGYGNFEEIGPLDVSLIERNTTWIKEASVLFIDNPVGAGYSYVEDASLFTTDVQGITNDLIVFITEFLNQFAPFRTIPIFIFGQSYGGKMGSHFALQLWKDIQAGTIQANLQGFAMGNSWISPIDSTLTWGPLLYSMALVDDQGYEAIQNAAGLCETAVNEERWNDATDLWGATESVVLYRTHYVDFYNILKFVLPGATGLKTHRLHNKYNVFLPAERATDPLDDLMNGEIKDKLGIIPENVTWGGQYDAVFTAQEGDFMKPVIATVDEVLQTTNLQVVVYEGQLDLICDTLGVMQWVQKLTWPNLANYNNATRQWFVNQDTRQTEMFVKAHNQFKFYWVLDAGHSVPKDNGNTAYRMMERILGNTDV